MKTLLLVTTAVAFFMMYCIVGYLMRFETAEFVAAHMGIDIYSALMMVVLAFVTACVAIVGTWLHVLQLYKESEN